MNKNQFVKLISDFCELESANITLETKFNSIKNFDSMTLLSMIVFIDENFAIQISGDKLKGINDFDSLIMIIGEEKFSND